MILPFQVTTVVSYGAFTIHNVGKRSIFLTEMNAVRPATLNPRLGSMNPEKSVLNLRADGTAWYLVPM